MKQVINFGVSWSNSLKQIMWWISSSSDLLGVRLGTVRVWLIRVFQGPPARIARRLQTCSLCAKARLALIRPPLEGPTVRTVVDVDGHLSHSYGRPRRALCTQVDFQFSFVSRSDIQPKIPAPCNIISCIPTTPVVASYRATEIAITNRNRNSELFLTGC